MIRFRDRVAENWLRSKSKASPDGANAPIDAELYRIVADGFERGDNPRKVGLELAGRVNPETGKRENGLITLDKLEEKIIIDFENFLNIPSEEYFKFELRNRKFDRSMRRHIRENTNPSSERIKKLVNEFEAKLIKQKADNFAQSLMLAALNRSNFISIKEATFRNNRNPLAITRVWESCGDDKVRESHRALDGQKVAGFEDCFISPITGAKMLYPGDQSHGAPDAEIRGCRCSIRYEIDFFDGVI